MQRADRVYLRDFAFPVGHPDSHRKLGKAAQVVDNR